MHAEVLGVKTSAQGWDGGQFHPKQNLIFLGVPSSQCVGLLGSERGVTEAREGETGETEMGEKDGPVYRKRRIKFKKKMRAGDQRLWG